MHERLILLPGWALGTAPLSALAEALRRLDSSLEAEIAELPTLASCDPAVWLAELDQRLPADTWLGGWSLGGMLATALAARRGGRCRGVLTLASNPRFVAEPGWPCAMPAATFGAFQQGCASDAHATLKRFALLCSQGGEDARGLSRRLFATAPQQAAESLLAGLAVLHALDTRAALAAIAAPQLHLFAEGDALVPKAAAAALSSLLPTLHTGLMPGTGHTFLLERPDEVATAIQAFIREHRQ